jgi:DNA polymerase sigma
MTSVVTPTQQGNGTPMFDFTFDPLFVEDPLSASNNVGRNAFRINQIQRVFSDAHRALVASLDWDIHSSADDGEASDYPLLKCLLQGKDVLYEL